MVRVRTICVGWDCLRKREAMIRGKICWFNKKDIKKIDSSYVFNETDVLELYNILEEHMLDLGFVLYDDEIKFEKEIIINRYHEIRYNCMVLKGTRRKGVFILKEIGIQYFHIK